MRGWRHRRVLAPLCLSRREITLLAQSDYEEIYESKRAAPHLVTGQFFRRTRILVVEDERHIARLLEFVLCKANYEVTICHSAEEAILEFVKRPPDAMVLDLVLPGMTGLEFLRLIRAAPYCCSSAVVVLSGQRLEETTSALQEAGATAQCSKPIAPSSLLRKLGELGIHHQVAADIQ